MMRHLTQESELFAICTILPRNATKIAYLSFLIRYNDKNTKISAIGAHRCGLTLGFPDKIEAIEAHVF